MRRIAAITLSLTCIAALGTSRAFADDFSDQAATESVPGVSPDADPNDPVNTTEWAALEARAAVEAAKAKAEWESQSQSQSLEDDHVWATDLPSPEPEPTNDSAAKPIEASAAKPWGACGITTNKHKLVRAFTRKAVRTTKGPPGSLAGGTTDLKCGSSEWGYRHLLKHRGEWQKNAAIERSNWRDLADFGIAIALIDPDVVTYRKQNDTYCFSREIYLLDKRTKRVVATKKPNIAVAAKSKNIITAFIPNSHCKG